MVEGKEDLASPILFWSILLFVLDRSHSKSLTGARPTHQNTQKVNGTKQRANFRRCAFFKQKKQTTTTTTKQRNNYRYNVNGKMIRLKKKNTKKLSLHNLCTLFFFIFSNRLIPSNLIAPALFTCLLPEKDTSPTLLTLSCTVRLKTKGVIFHVLCVLIFFS